MSLPAPPASLPLLGSCTLDGYQPHFCIRHRLHSSSNLHDLGCSQALSSGKEQARSAPGAEGRGWDLCTVRRSIFLRYPQVSFRLPPLHALLCRDPRGGF